MKTRSQCQNPGAVTGVPRSRRRRRPHSRSRPRNWKSEISAFCVGSGYRLYNPSTGRWINRDPIGEEGGVNVYSFCANEPLRNVEPFGLAYGNPVPTSVTLAQLTYESEGRAFRDPDLVQNAPWFRGTAIWWSVESGRQDSPNAYYAQSVHGIWGGICNSTIGSTSSSFVRASVHNAGPCCIKYRISCEAAFVAVKFGGLVTGPGGRPPRGEWTVNGTMLEAAVAPSESKVTVVSTGPVTSVAYFSKQITKDWDMAPGVARQLYNLSADVAMQVGSLLGGSFFETMAASCDVEPIGACDRKR